MRTAGLRKEVAMPTITALPDRSDLEQLKKQARELQQGVRAASRDCLALVAKYHPDGLPAPEQSTQFPLHAAQLVVARRHGFASWPALAGGLRSLAEERLETVERCKKAATGSHPDPERWRLITSARKNGVEVLAFRAPGSLLFCELTATTVTLSPPMADAPPARLAELAFHTANGTLAGTVSPALRRLLRLARTIDPGSDTWDHAVVADGVFGCVNAFALAGTGLRLSQARDADGAVTVAAEALPPQAVGIVDRPAPSADAAHPAVQRLRACLAHTERRPVAEIDQWVPGVYAQLTERESVQLGRHHDLLAWCTINTDGTIRATIVDLSRPIGAGPSRYSSAITTSMHFYDPKPNPRGHGTISTTRALVGLVLDARVASITMSCPGYPDTQAVIENGTFLLTDVTQDMRLRVRDRTGTLIQDLPGGPPAP
jgi:hypothetical protein